MKRSMVAVAAVMAVVLGVGLSFAGSYNAPITGEFAGANGAWTNAYGNRVAISAIIVNGVWSALTNSTIRVNNGTGSTLLVQKAATNTLAWLDGAGAIALERSGVISFSVASLPTLTNTYMIITKTD